MISICVYCSKDYKSNLTKFETLMIGVEQYIFTLSMYVNMSPYLKFYLSSEFVYFQNKVNFILLQFRLLVIKIIFSPSSIFFSSKNIL